MRVLIIGTDDATNGISGGDQRSRWVLKASQKAADETLYIHGPFGPQMTSSTGIQRFVNLLRRNYYVTAKKLPAHIFTYKQNRISQSKNLWNDLQRVEKLIPQYDVIQFEHCFGFHHFKHLLAGKKVIYSSHNVEYQMTAESSQEIGAKDIEKNQNWQSLKNNELELVARADLIYCCTEGDANHYQANSREDIADKIHVIPNGCSIPGLGDKQPLSLPFSKWILFISADHGPNLQGLMQACSQLTLPNDTGIVVAGGIRDTGSPTFKKFMAQETHNIHFTGRVSDAELEWLYNEAYAVLLPIFSGGGSNIKTAEALNSDRIIFAAPFAMRGFEQLSNSDGLHIFEHRVELEQLLAELFSKPITTVQRPECNSLSWERVVQPITGLLKSLATK